MFNFQQQKKLQGKQNKTKQTQESMVHSKEQDNWKETIPEKFQTLDLLEKDFKINFLK